MKSLIILSLAQAAIGIRRGGKYESDPETANDCIEFYDNDGSESCEHVRDAFSITPEQFHDWNPSIGLDCKPWHNFVSYCIVTMRRLEDTVWQEQGCYKPTTEGHAMEIYRNHEDRTLDQGLTIPKCLGSCNFAHSAGIVNGTQCWCSGTMQGDITDSKECDIPCDGDKDMMCGGTNRFTVYAQLELSKVGSSNGTMYQGSPNNTHVTIYTPKSSSTPTSTSGIQSGSVAAQSTVAAATPSQSSSGARRNRAFF